MAGTIKTDVIQSELTTPTVFRNSSGTEIGQLTRTWHSVNGASPGSTRASLNISSLTYNGTGDYTSTFSSAISDSNYSVQLSSTYATTTRESVRQFVNSFTTTTVRYLTGYSYTAPGATDHAIVCITLNR